MQKRGRTAAMRFFNVPAGGTDICNIPVPLRELGR
jgi:hypothetical protein